MHVAAEADHHRQQFLLLHLAQHAVDVEVIELQVEVGGHEVGELVVVVLLVDVEQLVVGGRHDGEAVLGQMLAEQRVELLQLRGVHQVLHVHAQPFASLEVSLHQLFLALLQTIDECLLLIRELQQSCLLGGTIVVVAPRFVVLHLHVFEIGILGEFPHQRVIPGGGAVDTSHVGILEGEALLGSGRIAQQANVAQLQARYIHVVVDAVEQLLNVDLRHGHRYCTLFLTAGGNHTSQADD